MGWSMGISVKAPPSSGPAPGVARSKTGKARKEDRWQSLAEEETGGGVTQLSDGGTATP